MSLDPRSDASPNARMLPLAVAAVVLGVFLRALPYPLQRSWDDGRFIIDNALVHHVSLQNLRAIFAAPHFQAYHPLHLLAYWLDVPWAGDSALLIHSVSLALWALGAALLARVFTRLSLSPAAAAIAALACAVHPAQVEVVSWATGRKDVLALLFVCLATLAHLRAERFGDRPAWLARALYVAAALSKTTVLPLPLVWFAADVLLRERGARRAALQQLPALVMGAGLAGLVIAIWRDAAMVRATVGSLAQAPARVASTLAHQLATALWPASNAPMYSTHSVHAPSVTTWLIALAFCLALTASLAARAKRLSFGLLTFVIFLLPVSNLVPMYYPYQDRYISLPLVGLAFAFGAGLDALARRGLRAPSIALGAALVGALGVRCIQYQEAWSNEPRLWGHAASVAPDAYYAWMKLGEVRRDHGDLDGAIRAYRRTLAVDPTLKVGHAALLQAVALRDEKLRGLEPSLAERYARAYFAGLDDASSMRDLAGRMLASGHIRSIELPMARALALKPMPDGVLERAAVAQFEAGRPTLGLFYLRQMKEPTKNERLRAVEKRVAELYRHSPL